MKGLIRDASIAKKLCLLTVLAVFIALSLCYGAFILNDIATHRAATLRQIESLASVLGRNSVSALEFDDRDAATETLSSLAAQSAIEHAVLRDAQGEIFATFPAKLPASLTDRRSEFLEVHRPINVSRATSSIGAMENLDDLFADDAATQALSDSNGTDSPSEATTIGHLTIRANTNEIYSELRGRTLVAAIVLVSSLLIGVSISMYFRHSITMPVHNLVTATRAIAEDRDYSHRVTKLGDDELGALANAFNAMVGELETQQKHLQLAYEELEQRVERRTEELATANADLQREMDKRESLQEELISASRHAGMAEIATGVLHNVGNVLNSVNVSAITLVDRVKNSHVQTVIKKLVDLLTEHKDDLATFFTSDPRGVQLPAFLQQLAVHVEAEGKEQEDELRAMMGHVDHIKVIVSRQQNYARMGGITEDVDLVTLVKDAMDLNGASNMKYGIEIKTDFDDVPTVTSDKHKILQILVNLFANAKQALLASESATKTLTLQVRSEGDMVSVSVGDNGVGIADENFKKLFTHGFTTKKTGHGFGLHSSACSAKEIGGSLSVHSDGLGKGAVFTLRIPAVSEAAQPV